MKAEEIIEKFKMQKHPEGGAFLETYRSELMSDFRGFEGLRSCSTGIYFLLQKGEYSALHQIKSDEMWHFYLGDPLEIIEIDRNGKLYRNVLGKDILGDQQVQYTVKAGHIFGSRPLGKFSLVGCTVSPGFDFKDFLMPTREELIQKYPQFEKLIIDLTYES